MRFLRVKIPTGTRANGNSTGKTFSSFGFVENLIKQSEKIERKRPVSTRLSRI
jgi:hypothetical protein